MEVTVIKRSKLLRHPSMAFGMILALFLAGVTFIGGAFVPHDPFEIDMGNRLQSAQQFTKRFVFFSYSALL